MKKLLLTAMIGLLAFDIAMAERWYLISFDKKEISFANLSSIDCEGSVCSLWVGQANVDKTKKYDSAMILYEFKCKRNEIRHSFVSLYLKGKAINTFSFDDKKFTPIIPGSLASSLRRIACSEESIHDERVMDKSFLRAVPELQKLLRSKDYQSAFK